MNLNPMKYKPSILVIDDEPVVCDSCDRLFSQSGYTVDTNIDPDQGFQKAIKNHYDAIILDLKLGEQDGIQLLYGIRENNPEVPVVIITGYPTQESKQMSEKLGVSDYITKPFDPDRILYSVRRITLRKFSAPEAAKVSEKATSVSGYLFFERSWFCQLTENSVQAGAFLPFSEASVSKIKMPEPGDIVYRGLPLAETILGDDTICIIHSPVSGRITGVNAALSEHPELLESCLIKDIWIATIETSDLKNDIASAENRKLLILNNKQSRNKDLTVQFDEMGYNPGIVKTYDEMAKILVSEKVKVVIIDARSLLSDGPEIVKRINSGFPEVNIILINESDAENEIRYRQNRIFYYMVNPVSNREMADILFCAFRVKKISGDGRMAVTGFLPNTISRIRITNRQGHNISLIAFNEILQNDHGPGSLLIRKLLDEAYPVGITHSLFSKSHNEDGDMQWIADEKEYSDRIIILRTGDIKRIPGTLIKHNSEFVNKRRSGNIIITITVQPAADKPAGYTFDAVTGSALANILLDEMVSE